MLNPTFETATITNVSMIPPPLLNSQINTREEQAIRIVFLDLNYQDLSHFWQELSSCTVPWVLISGEFPETATNAWDALSFDDAEIKECC